MKKKFNWIIGLIVIGSYSFFPINICSLKGDEEKNVQRTPPRCREILKDIALNLAMEKFSEVEILSSDMAQEDGCKIKGLSLLSEIYFLQGKMEQYEITLQKLYQLSPKKAEKITKLLHETPEEQLIRAIVIFEGDIFPGDDLISDNIKEATILLLPSKDSKERIQQALILIGEVLEIDPDNPEAQYLMGEIYMAENELPDYKNNSEEKLKLLDLARVCFEKAIVSNNKRTKYLSLGYLDLIGRNYESMDETKKLVEVGKTILKYKPKDKTAQRWSEIKDKENIEGINPSPTVDIPEEWRSMSPDEIGEYFQKQSEQREHLTKRQQWEESCKEFPNNPHFAFMLALEYLSIPGDREYHEKAKLLLIKAIQIKPDFSLAIYELGKYYLNNNQTSKAAEEFKKVEYLAPGFIADEYKALLDETTLSKPSK